MLPTVLDIYQAQRRIGDRIPKTPLLPSPWLSSIADGNVFLKIESANLTSSFKIRGAFNAALRLSEGVDSDDGADRDGVGRQSWPRARDGRRAAGPVVRGVHAGLRAGDEKERDPAPWRGASRRCENYDDAEKQAKAFAEAEGAVYISPYNHPDVIAGAGTIGLEIIEAMPQFDVVVMPLGGGGLASGVGLALKAAAPRVTIVGVEVEASSPFTLSLEAGRITEITPRPSLADGLVGNLEPGSITFPLVKQVVDYVVTVSEDELAAP